MWIALVLFEGVFVEQGGASTKVGHKELARDILMLKKLHRFLQSNNVPTPIIMILDGTSGTHAWDQGSRQRCWCASRSNE